MDRWEGTDWLPPGKPLGSLWVWCDAFHDDHGPHRIKGLHRVRSLCLRPERQKIPNSIFLFQSWFAESLAIDGCIRAVIRYYGQSPPPRNSTRFATFSTSKLPINRSSTVSENSSICRREWADGGSCAADDQTFHGTISTENHHWVDNRLFFIFKIKQDHTGDHRSSQAHSSYYSIR